MTDVLFRTTRIPFFMTVVHLKQAHISVFITAVRPETTRVVKSMSAVISETHPRPTRSASQQASKPASQQLVACSLRLGRRIRPRHISKFKCEPNWSYSVIPTIFFIEATVNSRFMRPMKAAGQTGSQAWNLSTCRSLDCPFGEPYRGRAGRLQACLAAGVRDG